MTVSVAWTSSRPGMANISPSGLASRLATGNVTITAASGAVSGSTPLTVVLPSPRFAYVANADDNTVSI
jgi:hypothetical protein